MSAGPAPTQQPGPVWTPQDLRAVAATLHGSPSGALPALARRIRVDERQMRRWAGGAPMPAGVIQDIQALFGVDAPPETTWRRDEWIVGEGQAGPGRRRVYVMHAWPPRFRCRAVEVDPDTGLPMPGEEPADVATGLAYSAAEDTLLTEFDWIDRTPTGQALAMLLEAAAAALHENGSD